MSTKTVTFLVEGMSCTGCSGKLEKALQAVNGVSATDVVLEGGQVTVTYDPALTSIEQLHETVEDVGFDMVK